MFRAIMVILTNIAVYFDIEINGILASWRQWSHPIWNVRRSHSVQMSWHLGPFNVTKPEGVGLWDLQFLVGQILFLW